MKKIFTLLAFAACCAAAAWSCSDEYDDSGLRQEIADIRQEIASMKEQVNSLKTLVDALNGNKFITNYTESDDGWSITFNDGKTITIRDGEKGADAGGVLRFRTVRRIVRDRRRQQGGDPRHPSARERRPVAEYGRRLCEFGLGAADHGSL